MTEDIEEIEEIEEIREALQELEVGDIFEYGYYKDILYWRVLDKTSDSLLVVSEYAVEHLPFNKGDRMMNKWNGCTLKKWLNSEFLDKSFSLEEESFIKNTPYGKVFCLSIEEAERYFSSDSDRRCKPDSYASRNISYTEEGYCWRWLRSSGDDVSRNFLNSSCAAMVVYTGKISIHGQEVSLKDMLVRPAMRLKI